MIRRWVGRGRVWLSVLFQRIVSSCDSLAVEPAWRQPLIRYLVASALLRTAAGLVHQRHGIALLASLPIAGAVPFGIAAHAVNSLAREGLASPLYFVVLTGLLFTLSRLTPGARVSFRQLFSVTVHTGYILLAGHALRVGLAAWGVELAEPAATLLPDPDAMFVSEPAGNAAPNAAMATSVNASIAFSMFGSPADVLSVGVFETAFHALLGAAYCRIRSGTRPIVGAAWGAGLSLLIDILWLLWGVGR